MDALFTLVMRFLKMLYRGLVKFDASNRYPDCDTKAYKNVYNRRGSRGRAAPLQNKTKKRERKKKRREKKWGSIGKGKREQGKKGEQREEEQGKLGIIGRKQAYAFWRPYPLSKSWIRQYNYINGSKIATP